MPYRRKRHADRERIKSGIADLAAPRKSEGTEVGRAKVQESTPALAD